MRPRTGLALLATSVTLMLLVAGAGPSAATQDPAGAGGGLPWSAAWHWSPATVTGLLDLAVLIAVAGLVLCWRALAAGWAPDPRRLVAAGAIAAGAFCLVPPTSSDDIYSYTAYGRLVVLGVDAYTVTPAELPDDPVEQAAGDPWRNQASVYGPLATAEQALAAKLGGPDPRRVAWALQVLSALAFAALAVLLHRAAPDVGARRRAALLVAVNPLLLVHLVSGAHVDGLLALLGLGVVVLVRDRPWAAGLVGGLAATVKVTGGLVVLGVAWTLRRRPVALAGYLVVGAAVLVSAYTLGGGLHLLTPLREASRRVSFGSPWRLVVGPLEPLLGAGPTRALVSALSLLLGAGLAVVLARRLPPAGGRHGTAARAALVVVLAWLLSATYVLPWYDALAWPLLALVERSRWDLLLLARTAVLSVAYLPGRTVPFPAWLSGTLGAVRGVLTPLLLLALIVVVLGPPRWLSPGRSAPSG